MAIVHITKVQPRLVLPRRHIKILIKDVYMLRYVAVLATNRVPSVGYPRIDTLNSNSL